MDTYLPEAQELLRLELNLGNAFVRSEVFDWRVSGKDPRLCVASDQKTTDSEHRVSRANQEYRNGSDVKDPAGRCGAYRCVCRLC